MRRNAVPPAPQHHRTGISEQAGLVLRQLATGEPQILEGGLRRQSNVDSSGSSAAKTVRP